MKKRLDFYQASTKTIDGLAAFSSELADSFTDHKLKALVELRVSQIDESAYCVDLHSTEARTLGEHQQRLDCLPVWREVAFFSDKERAVFAWAEAVTLVAQTRAPDDVYDEVKKYFTDAELVVLTAIIGTMNLWNRMRSASEIRRRKEFHPEPIPRLLMDM